MQPMPGRRAARQREPGPLAAVRSRGLGVGTDPHRPHPRPTRIWYFFFYGGLVFFMPYVPLFLKRDLGWEPWRVGCATCGLC
jgi:hypothetical protein